MGDIKNKTINRKWIYALFFCGFWKGVTLEQFMGAGVAGIVFFLILFFAPGSFGGGDVKLSLALGYYLGAEKWFYSFAIAVFLAGMVIHISSCATPSSCNNQADKIIRFATQLYTE